MKKNMSTTHHVIASILMTVLVLKTMSPVVAYVYLLTLLLLTKSFIDRKEVVHFYHLIVAWLTFSFGFGIPSGPILSEQQTSIDVPITHMGFAGIIFTYLIILSLLQLRTKNKPAA